MAEQVTDKVVGIFVAAILAAALIPVALQLLATANTTGFDAATLALFGVLSIAVIVVVVVLFFKMV